MVLVSCLPSYGEQTTIVKEVLDGDTILTLTNERVRLVYIDAPELDQECRNKKRIGEVSTKYLASLVQGKEVVLKVYGKGFYGRKLAEIYRDDENINLKLVRKGMAYAYPYGKYLDIEHKQNYRFYQDRAKRKRKGVWSCKRLLRPWSYRKKKRASQKLK